MIFENAADEQKLLTYKDKYDDCVDYFSLQEFYEGLGENAKAVFTAEKDIQKHFCGGENPPHMWWGKLEVKLTNAFSVIDKNI